MSLLLAAVHAAPPHTREMNIPFFLGGLRPSEPSHRVGVGGKPVSPYPWLEGGALPNPPASGGVGKPGFPTPLAKS